MNCYIHIPFCTQKCTYCKFALTPIFDEYKKKKYLHFLENEITKKLQKYNNETINTIYFGGGTPSILNPEEIEKIIKIFPNWEKEITLESNPEDLNEKYLQKIFEIGINRLSIGIQSLNNKTLEAVERKNSEKIFSALKSIKDILVWKVWKNILFRNKEISINIDMILGLPEAKKWEILENIKFLHKNYNFITHTSVYILEKWKYPELWQKNSLSDEEIYEEYWEICKYFEEIWWNHYEVSNFAKPWYESRHNLGYWNHENSLGFGLSAAEFIKNSNGKNLQKWKQSFATRRTNSLSFSWYYKEKLADEELLSEEQILLEKFLFTTRTFKIIKTEDFPFLNHKKIKNFLERNIIEWDEKFFKIPEKSIPILDYITDEIIF